MRQFTAKLLADVIDRASAKDAVRPREVNIFKDARPRMLGGKGADRLDAVACADDDFTRFDFAHEFRADDIERRSEEHTSELQSLMRISYAVFCLKKKKKPEPAHMKTHHQKPRDT